MRSIWKGAIGFGLVNIPIRVYSATEERGLNFDMLHEKDLSPIRYARVCRREGEEIPYEEIVKGYEYRDGDYVVLVDEDFKKANLRKTKTIDIQDFVKEQEIDKMLFDKPYYLEPDKGAEKAYVVLREALKKSKKVGVAKFVFRNRERLGVITSKGKLLILNQLRFAQEIRSAENLNLPDMKLAQGKEVDIALKLIDQLTEPFKAKEYKDTYTEELKDVIAERARGRKPRAKGTEPTPTKVPDLMAVLRRSLEQQRHRGMPS